MTFSFKIDFPAHLRLQIDGDKVRDKVGQRISRVVKARLKDGVGAEGSMPPPKPTRAFEPAGRPLHRTGQMIRSVRYDKKNSVILPSGKRDDGKRNVAIMFIQLAERPDLAATDPMGVTDAMESDANAAAEKEIARQFSSGEYGLIAELRRMK